MKGIRFGQLVLYLFIVIQAAMKCQASFCDNRYDRLMEEIRNATSDCTRPAEERSPCCEAHVSSLEERTRNHKILCPSEGELYKSIFLYISLLFPSNFKYLIKLRTHGHFFLELLLGNYCTAGQTRASMGVACNDGKMLICAVFYNYITLLHAYIYISNISTTKRYGNLKLYKAFSK